MKQPKKPGLISMAVVLSVLVFLLPGPVEARIGGEEREPPPASDRFSPYDAGDTAASPESLDLAPNSPQVITAWYGPTQSFGQLGVPQQWVNILGNVSNPSSVSGLGYSLNNGPVQSLSVGADTWRLVSDGDFNIELDYTLLQNGANQVVISAGGQSSTIVTVDYESGNVWPNPYYIDWSSVQNIQDVAQIVDGQWTVTGGRLRPVVTGYDRLVNVGDMTWVDYEVVVPITIHSYSGPDPGVGILVRWNGHGNDSYQPHYAHPFGGLGWYRRYPGESNFWLAIMGNGGENIAASAPVLSLGKTYIFKMRVETQFNGTSYYSLKVWEAGTSEPPGWDLSGPGKVPDIAHGSVLLVAHRTDASFGNVSITPVQAGYTLLVTPLGEGTVAKSPDKPAYGYAEVVRLTPTAAAGWTFDSWSGTDAGDVADNGDGTWSLAMVKDREVTANFSRNACALTVEIVGHGTVDPPQGVHLYDCGTEVVLSPTPDPGWRFNQWAGPNAPELVDNGDGTWSLMMDGDKSVTAEFGQELYEVTVMVEGQGIVNLDPKNPYVYSQVATLWPIPSPGWGFAGWSGPNGGEVVGNGDGTWSLTVDGHKEVKAEFMKYQVFIPLVAQAY